MKQLLSKLKSYGFIQDIESTGGKVYLVGGIVRDHLLGKESKDIDLLITGVPSDNLVKLLKRYGKVDEVGVSFGVIKLNIPGELEMDIALPRTEIKTSQGHTGFDVSVDHTIPIEVDLYRRDFTINAIAMNMDGYYTDPYNGIGDIHNKLIRTVSETSFQDDPLRILRAFQFAARFKFKIEQETWYRLKRYTGLISQISGERMNMEFHKMVTKGDPKYVIDHMFSSELMWQLYNHVDLKDHYQKYSGQALYPKVGNIKTIPQLLATLFNFPPFVNICSNVYKNNLNDYFKLSTSDNKELISIINLINTPIEQQRYRLFIEAKNWPGIWNTEYFNITPNPIQWIRCKLGVYKESDRVYMLGKNIKLFRKGVFPKHRKEIVITSEELQSLGYEGRELGELHDLIVKAILDVKLPNKRIEILQKIHDGF